MHFRSQTPSIHRFTLFSPFLPFHIHFLLNAISALLSNEHEGKNYPMRASRLTHTHTRAPCIALTNTNTLTVIGMNKYYIGTVL